jgi:hypothetical protein
MQLGITIPFQKFLKVKQPPYGGIDDLFFCWEAHHIKLGGRSTLFVVNANNRFATIVSCMKGYDWRQWDIIAVDAIHWALELEGFTQSEIDRYFSWAGPEEVTKTHGRKPVANMNRLIDDLWDTSVDPTYQFQPGLVHAADSQLICKAAGFEDYGCATERFREDLQRFDIARPTAKIIPFPQK